MHVCQDNVTHKLCHTRLPLCVPHTRLPHLAGAAHTKKLLEKAFNFFMSWKLLCLSPLTGFRLKTSELYNLCMT
jgi:hypothetical protein